MLSISAGFSRLNGLNPELNDRMGLAGLLVPGKEPVFPSEEDRNGTPSTRNIGLLAVGFRLFKPRIVIACAEPGRPLVCEISRPGMRPSSTSMGLLTGSWAISAAVTEFIAPTLKRRV